MANILPDRMKRNDGVALSILEVAGKSIAGAQGGEIGPRRHDDLKAARVADVKADVEKPVHQFKCGRLGNIENGIKVTGGHSTTPPTRTTAEPRNVPLSNINAGLQSKDRIDSQLTGPRRVIFVGMEDTGPRPIPFFRLPRGSTPLPRDREACARIQRASRILAEQEN